MPIASQESGQVVFDQVKDQLKKWKNTFEEYTAPPKALEEEFRNVSSRVKHMLDNEGAGFSSEIFHKLRQEVMVITEKMGSKFSGEK